MMGTLVLTEKISQQILERSRQRDEVAGVLLCGLVRGEEGNVRLTSREMVWLDNSAYDEQSPYSLLLNSQGYIQPLSRAEAIGATPIWVHTHPGESASPLPSSHDVVVDKNIAEVFRIRSGSNYYGALIFSPSRDRLA